MGQRPVVPLCLLAMVAVLVTPSSASGQSASDGWTTPRTADGQPDLQGVWANNSATPLERPEALAEKTNFTDEEVEALKQAADRLFGGAGDAAFGDGVFQAALANLDENVSGDGQTGNYSSVWMVDRDFDNRTSLITDPADGRIPPLTPEAEQRRTTAREHRRLHPYDGPEDLSLQLRCITYGVPRLGGLAAGYNSYYQIVQNRDYVVIVMEMIHDARIIPLGDQPHLSENLRQWLGDSRGHWEGDTLVVDTTNFSTKSNYRGSSENLHLVERFTRVSPDVMHYELTLDDPTTWTTPWSAMILLKKDEAPIFEYACQEGNYGMEGILAGARAQEKSTGTEAAARP